MNKKTLTGLILAPLFVVGVIACGGGGEDDAVEGPGAQAQVSTAAKDDGRVKLEMKVLGAKKASITYGLNGETSQDNGAKVPWKKTMEAPTGDLFSVAMVSAQNAGSGMIKCEIWVDGKLVKKNQSSGEYAIVDCTIDQF